MFWVIIELRFPVCSSLARAKWAGLGLDFSSKPPISFNMVQTFLGLAENASMVAYSMGSYFSHSPEGPRKSGIPLSTDIPAPVQATHFLACRIAWAVFLIKSSFIPVPFLLWKHPG